MECGYFAVSIVSILVSLILKIPPACISPYPSKTTPIAESNPER